MNRATTMCPTPNVTVPYKFVGCGGTAPSPSLELLSVATAMASSLRLGYEAVAPQRGPLYFFSDLLGLTERREAPERVQAVRP